MSLFPNFWQDSLISKLWWFSLSHTLWLWHVNYFTGPTGCHTLPPGSCAGASSWPQLHPNHPSSWTFCIFLTIHLFSVLRLNNPLQCRFVFTAACNRTFWQNVSKSANKITKIYFISQHALGDFSSLQRRLFLQTTVVTLKFKLRALDKMNETREKKAK